MADKIKNKEIVKEFPINLINCSNSLQFYRFPISIKNLNITELRIKPISKFVEIFTKLPTKNVSALKTKMLNSEKLAFRAFPTESPNCFLAKFENDRLFLYKIQNIYLFQPFHFYYSFDYSTTKLKKAESREEYEHRMKSINYKLKNVDLEEFNIKSFEDVPFIPKVISDIPDNLSFKNKNDINDINDTSNNKDVINKDTNNTTNIINKDTNNTTNNNNYTNINAINKKIENVIKRTRIVNLKTLIEMFQKENAVKTILFKMADQISGRFILKNKFYEKSLHEKRNTIFKLFLNNDSVKVSDFSFLREERWLIDELADIKNGKYYLKGFYEYVNFDNNSIKMANLLLIREILIENRILSISQISTKLGIDEDLVLDILSEQKDFHHLSNNSYSLRDESFILNDMFEILTFKKSFEITELIQKLESKNINFDIEELTNEIKKYCNLRSNRYYLKVPKD